MVADTLLVLPPTEVAETFLRTARKQLQAAQAQEWDTVYQLANFRELLLERLAKVTAGPLEPLERERMIQDLAAVQDMDAELMRQALHERGRLKDELKALDRGRAIVGGYHWASAPAPHASVDRYS
jgi:hypothetical protein